MSCAGADAVIFRIKQNDELKSEYKLELVQTIKDYTPECEFYWDANDWRNGIKTPSISGAPTMNTLNLIKKQIQKASALHDARIAMTSYRGVKYECKQGSEEIHGTFCYRGHSYNKWSSWKHYKLLGSYP